MLLDGSFSKDVLNILDALKMTRRRRIQQGRFARPPMLYRPL